MNPMETETKKKKILFPLALKMVGLTSLLVMTVAITIAWRNSELFSQISSDREEANVEMVTSSKALEVEAILESYFEKMAVLAFDDKGRVSVKAFSPWTISPARTRLSCCV